MANDKKFVVKNGLTTQNISFVDSVTSTENTINISMTDNDSLSFSGAAGQLFSITDSMSGTIFAVNDISGVPSVEVDDDGTIRLAELTGNILIGTATDNGTDKLQVNGTVSANTFVGVIYGNANTAASWQTARTLSLGGDLSGSVSIDGSQNVTLTATVADDSHNHVISNVDGLQTALDAKAPLASPALTGVPTAPTAANTTNTTQIATTAFVHTAVADLVSAAPITLDTLNELAAALGDDPNFATTVTNSIASKVSKSGDTMTGALTIDGTDVDTAPILNLQSGNGSTVFNNGAQIRFGYNDTNSYAHFIHTRHNGGNAYNAIDFYVSNGTADNSVTSGSIHTMSLVSGSVGIGTTSPQFKLHVSNSNGNDGTFVGGILVENTNTDTGESAIAFKNAGTGGTGSNYYLLGLNQGADLTFAYGTTFTSGNVKMTLSAGGNLGIGTTSPSQKLYVVGTGYATADFRAPIFYDSADTNYYLDPANSTTSLKIAAHVKQGNNFAHPNIEWSASSGATGEVIFYIPGGSGNYGMLHMVFDIYEYNGLGASTIIIGGHNWNGAWYNISSQVIGDTNKSVRLGFKNGQYCVIFGGVTSSWSYGQIRLRKIQNGSYYDNTLDLGGAWTTELTTTESFTWVSSDLRALETPGSFYAGGNISGTNGRIVLRDDSIENHATAADTAGIAVNYYGYQSAAAYFRNLSVYNGKASLRFKVYGSDNYSYASGSMRSPIFYDSDDTAYYVNPASESNIGTIRIGGAIQYTTGGAAKVSIYDAGAGSTPALTIGASNNDLVYFRRLSAGSYQWQTYNSGNSGSLLFQPYGGNVGIGTTSPNAKVEIVNTSAGAVATQLFLHNASDTDGTGARLDFAGLAAGTIPTGSISNIRTGSGAYALTFNNYGGGSNAERLRITSTGNVGIGTTNPSGRLDIQENSTSSLLTRIWNTNTSGTGSAILRLANSGNGANGTRIELTDNTYYVATIAADRTEGLKFFVGQMASALATERVRIDINGNVGIGTSSPSAKLTAVGTVKSASLTQSAFYLSNATQTAGFLLGRSLSSDDAQNFFIYDTVAASTRLYLDSSGNVGINTGAPTDLLTVNIGDLGFICAGGGSQHINFRNAGGTVIQQIKYSDADGSLTFGGGASSDFPLIFRTAANERMRITSAGNVGIGTASPASLLHIRGGAATLEIDSSTNTANLDFDNSTQTARIQLANNDFATLVGGTERVRITSSGNVGIGTSSPSRRLDVRTGSFNSSVAQFTGANDGRGLLISTFNRASNDDSVDYDAQFGGHHTFSSSGVEYVRITNTGNVGIGTGSPQTKLDIRGTSATVSSTVQIVGNSVSTLLLGQNSTGGVIRGQGGNNALSFWTGGLGDTAASGSGTERVRIDSSGNVGIGTSSPTTRLHISQSNSGNYASVILLSNSADAAADRTGIFGSAAPGNSSPYRGGITFWPGAAGAVSFHTGNSATPDAGERVRINSSGDVGIGTSAPSQKLHVVGTGYASTDFRAPIFYDSDNTAYYTNPASTSIVSFLGRANHHTGHLVGSYNNVGANDLKSNPIYTIGSSYNPSDAALGNMYGIGYCNNNASFISLTGAAGWGMYVAADGDARVFLDGGNGRVSASGAAYIPIYYDYNDTNYYGDFGNTSLSLNIAGPIRFRNFTSTNDHIQLWGAGASNGYGIGIEGNTQYFRSNQYFRWYIDRLADAGANDTMELSASGLTINGALNATTKSFLIDHPTKPGKKLRYGSLEGPENGVYIRGKIKGNVIELPDYWPALVDPESITVQLTAIGKGQKLYVEDIRDNKVYIANDGVFAGEPNCFYFVQAERVDVDKLVVEE